MNFDYVEIVTAGGDTIQLSGYVYDPDNYARIKSEYAPCRIRQHSQDGTYSNTIIIETA